MGGQRFYWLKLNKDFFKSKRIKKLRKLAGGDTFTIIYLKMQLLATPTEGILTYTGLEETAAEEIALDIDEDPENVKITLQYLLKTGLCEMLSDNELFLPFVADNVGSEGSSAKRVRDFRERQKALQCNTPVTGVKQIVNGEKEIEIEKELEIEIEKDKRVNYQQIADMYNDTCVSFPRVSSLSDARKKAIKARLKTYTLDDFALMFQKAEASSFLKGGNDRNWSANFDWMIKDANMAKILDGNYDNKSGHLDKSYNMMSSWAEEE